MESKVPECKLGGDNFIVGTSGSDSIIMNPATRLHEAALRDAAFAKKMCDITAVALRSKSDTATLLLLHTRLVAAIAASKAQLAEGGH